MRLLYIWLLLLLLLRYYIRRSLWRRHSGSHTHVLFRCWCIKLLLLLLICTCTCANWIKFYYPGDCKKIRNIAYRRAQAPSAALTSAVWSKGRRRRHIVSHRSRIGLRCCPRIALGGQARVQARPC